MRLVVAALILVPLIPVPLMPVPLIPVLGLLPDLLWVEPAAAQDVGGISGYALQTPRSAAAQMQSMLGATDRRSQNQAQVARLRGDAGYLGGFAFGQPLSPSVQKDYGYGYADQAPVVVNEFDGPVVVGNGNVVQQQTAVSNGPIAQQQVAGSGAGGATNVVTGSGRITQSAPARAPLFNAVQTKVAKAGSIRRPPAPPQLP